MNLTRAEIIAKNKLFAEFMDSDIFKYRDSGMVDINGNKILEGNIINANGYDSIPEEGYFHIVEFCEGAFGSDVYGDFDLLSSYQTIEVVGHVTDYVHRLDEKDDDDEFKFSNINGALKGEATCLYHRSWNQLMPIIHKISTEVRYKGFPINVTISGHGGAYIAINSGNCAGEEYKGEKRIADTLNLNYCINDTEMEYQPIELVWLAVAEFIEWYNKNKESFS